MSEEKASFGGIIVAAYLQEEAAKEMLDKINDAKKQKRFEFWDAVVIRKDEKGHFYYDETRDMSTPMGAGIGAVIGGLIGIPGGPAGVVLGSGLGAALGGFMANTDAGIKDERLEDVGYSLQSGNSALVIVSSHDYLRNMQEYADDDKTTRAVNKLRSGISEHMIRGQNIAYHITSAGRSVSCHRLRDESIAELLGVGTPAE